MTTDRITGRATIRGQVEALEGENNFLRQHVAVLQAQIREMGAEPRAMEAGYNGCAPAPHIAWDNSSLQTDTHAWGAKQESRRPSATSLPGYGTAGTTSNGADGPHLPPFKTGAMGENYLGVSSADSLLSHLKGTKLAVFGHEIDITDFVQGQEDYETSVMSYGHFLDVALNVDRQVEQLPFPEYTQLDMYANFYLRTLNPYTMLLDKPTFKRLVCSLCCAPLLNIANSQ